MERFKIFIGKDVNFEKLKDIELYEKYGFKCQNIPENFEEFEEIELLLDNFVLCIAILNGKVKRIMFTKITEDPDVCYPLSKEELENLLQNRGESLVQFFEIITS